MLWDIIHAPAPIGRKKQGTDEGEKRKREKRKREKRKREQEKTLGLVTVKVKTRSFRSTRLLPAALSNRQEACPHP
ncbi:hypothetical protein PWT90_07539 [Aphanocladium album]|nr:hypothetical protein PWT90_07539 [Aphanocladium album]